MLFLVAFSLVLRLCAADLLRSTITQWFWVTSIPVGPYLYLSGGEDYETDGSSITYNPRNDTLIIDLTQSWTNRTLVATASFSNPADLPRVRQPVLFHDSQNNVIKRYGGWPYDTVEMPSELWSFPVDTTSPTWTEEIAPTANGLSTDSLGPMSPAAVATNSTFYSLGGNIIDATKLPDQTVLSGLVTQDLSTGVWSNLTTVIPNQSNYRNMAKAIYVPDYGAAGFLVFVGGDSPPTEEGFYEQGQSMVDMSIITLYDISSGIWYTQTATGDIPPPRVEFCAVGAASTNNSAFDIFIYGGSTNDTLDGLRTDDEGYLNVFALSLPAFEWFKSPSRTTVRRAANTCSIIGNRQMISVGGYFPSSRQGLGVDKDPWVSGIGVFDMTQFAWADRYNAKALAYESPDVIKEYYSTSYKQPDWSDTVLSTVFAFTAPPGSTSNSSSSTTDSTGTSSATSSSTSSPSSSSSSPSSSSSSPSSRSSSNTGALAGGIAGGVVAGVAALGAIIGFFIWNRRRQQSQSQQAARAVALDPYKTDTYYGSPPAALQPQIAYEKHGSDAPSQLSADPLLHEAPSPYAGQELDASMSASSKYDRPYVSELPASTHFR